MLSTVPRFVRRLVVVLASALAVGGVGAVGSPALAAPNNDMLADALTITGWDGSTSSTTVGATRESGEPTPGSYDDQLGDGPSVWFKWTAPADGLIKFDTSSTRGAWIPPMDVFTGEVMSDLSYVNQASCDDGSDWSDVSCYYVDVTAGVTYRIQVATSIGTSYPFTLQWSHITAPPNDDFANATALKGQYAELPELEQKSGRVATGQPGEPNHANGEWESPQHSLWYSWTSPWYSRVTIETYVGYPPHDICYDTSALAVYRGSSVGALSYETSDTASYEDGCAIATVSFWAQAGVNYSFAVDAPWSTTPVHGSLTAEPQCDRTGTSGNDTIVGTAAANVLCGLGGDDVIKGQGGDDLIIGGPGVDSASYADAPNGVTANLTTGTAAGHGTDSLQDIESLIGSRYNDKLDGSPGINFLTGGAGTDGLWGQGGLDTINGLAGNDTIGGGAGDDRINGGTGIDTAHFGAAPAAVTVNLTTGSSTGEGTDALAAMEDVLGSPSADKLTGSGGVNRLQGAGGNDTVAGSGGNDKLYGAAGSDTLTGGVGTDLCDGGTEADTAFTCETKVSIP